MGEAPTPYLSTRQAAALLGLSPRTLERYRVTGGGPPFLTYCSRVHYLRSDLDAWALAGRRLSTSDDGSAAGARTGPSDRNGRVICARRGPRAASLPETAALAGQTGAGVGGHLSVCELAALLQVSRRTLDRYRARGEGPAFEKVNGRVLYARADVEAWLASGRRDPIRGTDGDDPDGAGDGPEGAR